MTVEDAATRPPATAAWRLLGVVAAGAAEIPDTEIDVEIVEHGAVAAALAPHDDQRPVRELLREHAELVDRLFAAAPVLPARYGVLMEDAELARTRLLAPHEHDLAQSLREVESCVEVTVRVQPDDTGAAQEAVDRDPLLRRDAAALQRAGSAAPHAAKMALGERIASAVAQIAEQDVALVHDRLQPLAVSVRGESPAPGGALLVAAYLVERDRFEAFDTAVGEVTEALRPRASVTAVGPLPPYSFADLQAG